MNYQKLDASFKEDYCERNGNFHCTESLSCVLHNDRCDGTRDFRDGEDEESCEGKTKLGYQETIKTDMSHQSNKMARTMFQLKFCFQYFY